MEEKDSKLTKKILWAQNFDEEKETSHLNKQIIHSCKRLEEEGFGLLGDKDNPEKIDKNISIVCPNGEIFTPEQITNYLIRRKGRFNSKDIEDIKMHKINIYYFGFKERYNYMEEKINL
jgi:hypothetical protein